MQLKTQNSKLKTHNKAIQLLSQREHSYYELITKLQNKYPDIANDLITAVVTELKTKNYQSDQRYSEMLIKAKVAQGNGRIKIEYLLSQQRVDSSHYAEALSAIDWVAQAVIQLQKRTKSTDNKQKTKQFRYLQSKGFNLTEITKAWEELVLSF